MFDKVDEFEDVTRLSEAFHRAVLKQHLELDRGGVQAGQMVRVEHGHVKLAIEDRKSKERLSRLMFETALEALLADPVYRARHEKFGKFLDEYEAAARAALQRAIEASEAAHAAVQEALATANRLDGKPVFVTDAGRIVYRDGTDIDPADAGRIDWRYGAKSYEDYLALVDTASAADAAVTDIRGYRDDLTAAREKWVSPDNPYESVEEMDAHEARLKADTPKLVADGLSAGTVPSPSPNDGITSAGKLTLPK